MSAKNFSLAKYGLPDDSSATGLFVAEIGYDFKSEKSDIRNHVNQVVGFTLADESIAIKCSGVVTTKTAGITPNIAGVITYANTSAHSLDLKTSNTFATPVANAGVIVLGMSLKRVNSEHETGDIDSIFHPGVTSNAPVDVT